VAVLASTLAVRRSSDGSTRAGPARRPSASSVHRTARPRNARGKRSPLPGYRTHRLAPRASWTYAPRSRNRAVVLRHSTARMIHPVPPFRGCGASVRPNREQPPSRLLVRGIDRRDTRWNGSTAAFPARHFRRCGVRLTGSGYRPGCAGGRPWRFRDPARVRSRLGRLDREAVGGSTAAILGPVHGCSSRSTAAE
jgi:hypothetical protein